MAGPLEELPTLLLGSALVSLLLGFLAATARLLGRNSGRNRSGDRAAKGAYECGFAPFAALSSSSLLLFHRLAVFFVVFESELIFLFPWAAALPAAAAPGALAHFLAPLGFVLLLFYGYARELWANALKLLLLFRKISSGIRVLSKNSLFQCLRTLFSFKNHWVFLKTIIFA